MHSIYRIVVLWLAAACLPVAASCPDEAVNFDGANEGWGLDQRNTRYQPNTSINSQNADRLKLKWVYRLSTSTPRSWPLVTEKTIVIGDAGRGLVALDRDSGCEKWLYPHEGYISSAILKAKVDDRWLLIFNDRSDGVHAIDPQTGKLVWRVMVDDEPLPMYSGTPLLDGHKLFVPVSSQEVGLAVNPLYGCCTSSGGIAAFDIRTAKKLWYRPTIVEDAEVTGSHFFFVNKYGPSGAPVWGAPSFDVGRDLVFYGTGQNYSHPTTDTSDAIFATKGSSGEVVWHRQFTANDAYTAACNVMALNHPNCPKPTGPDVDFGAPTLIARSATGRDLLIAGQKSADVYAMDPDTGEVLWNAKLGRGGIIGGVHWGMAVDEGRGQLYVPISDKKIVGFPSPGDPAPGLYALDIETGELRWRYTRESRCADLTCEFGLSAAVIAANGIVVSGSMDGFLVIHDSQTGEALWTHDAFREYGAVNADTSEGGAFDAHGPMLAGDQLIVSSGYRYVGNQRGGNALLVFELESQDE